MGPSFYYIFGLRLLFAGTVSAFLLDASLTNDKSNIDACTEWGEWRVLSEHPVCFIIHERNSASNKCNKTEYNYCKDVAKWSEWGPLDCTVGSDMCIIERTRNCSVKDLTDCYSNETSKDLTIWGDMNTCPCTKGQTVDIEKGNGHWQAWSGWRCQVHSDHCYVYRARQCSAPDRENCPPKDSSQLKLWTDTCPCEKNSVIAGTNQTANISASTAVWKEWGEWKCHDADFGCIMSRNRQCSSEERVCQGQHYELDVCKAATCKELATSSNDTTTIPSTQLMWTDWGAWECHNNHHPCVLYRYRSCSNGHTDSCSKSLDGRKYEIRQCDDTCKGISHKPPSTMLTSELTTALTTTITTPISRTTSIMYTATSNGQTTVSNSTNTTTTTTEYVPTYWLEWSGWECTFPIPGVCLMGHTRNCSISDVNRCITELGGVGYKIEPCRSAICPATWLEWGKWRCRMGDHGICNMTRTRECSTKSKEDCGTESEMIKPCKPNVCPELVTLQQSGRCKDYVSGNETCTDASTCDIITNIDNPVCSYHNTASKACPKACGCCEEQPHWLEWSPWKCNLAPNRTCEMKKTRKCSTDSLDDCVGQDALNTKCSNSVCPVIIHASATVDCSGFDAQTTKCKDGAGCSEFISVIGLSFICSEQKEAAECPVSCGCCVVKPTITTVPTKQSTTTTSSTMASSTNFDTTTINVNGKWSDWQEWSKCSTTCSAGTRSRNRTCTNPTPAHGGSNCTGGSSMTETCNKVRCPVNGKWSDWLEWSKCSKSCSAGTRSRYRQCSNPTPAYGGNVCTGDFVMTETCNDVMCPVNGKWSDWQEWSKCSQTCSAGTRSRDRTCTNPTPAHGGSNCTGGNFMTDTCNNVKCPEWSHWFYDACSVSCGNGTTTRLRHCSSGKDADCGSGKAFEKVICSEKPCPINGNWSDWQEWSKCSQTCSAGTRSRDRTCTNPTPAHGGSNCTGDSSMTETCNHVKCPEWSHWFHDACSVTCGNGTTTRLRHCSSGKDTDCGTGKAFETVMCNERPCSIDGSWGAWTASSKCTVSCGDGVHMRSRLCNSPSPKNGGAVCKGPQNETATCKIQDCPYWLPFGEATSCSVTCGKGFIQMKRNCSTGIQSDCTGSTFNEKTCILKECL